MYEASLNYNIITFSLFSEFVNYECDNRIHKALVLAIPPRYHSFVLPSPIYIYDAVFKVFYFVDLQVPRIPLIFIYLLILILKLQAKGKLSNPTSFC